MQIAVLGTGHMGRTLGGGLIRAGHDLVFGSRDPGQAADLPAPAHSHAEAITRSDVVISALAAAHSLRTLTPLRQPLADRVLIDIGNAVDERMDLIYPDSSLGERLQRALPDPGDNEASYPTFQKTAGELETRIGFLVAALTNPTNLTPAPPQEEPR